MRVQVALHAELRHEGSLVPVRDLSFEGFAIESRRPVEPGTKFECELLPYRGPSQTLLVEAVRSERHAEAPTFVTGFRFAMVEPDSRQRINSLIDVVASDPGLGCRVN